MTTSPDRGAAANGSGRYGSCYEPATFPLTTDSYGAALRRRWLQSRLAIALNRGDPVSQ